MLKYSLRLLSPIALCLLLAGCNIYPYETPATPLQPAAQPVYYFGFKPPIQPLNPAVNKVAPAHGTGYKPPIAPITPPVNNVTPSHATGYKPPIKTITPSAKPIAKPASKTDEEPLDSDLN